MLFDSVDILLPSSEVVEIGNDMVFLMTLSFMIFNYLTRRASTLIYTDFCVNF